MCQTTNISLVGPAAGLPRGSWVARGPHVPPGVLGPSPLLPAFPARPSTGLGHPGAALRGTWLPRSTRAAREERGTARVAARFSTGHAKPTTPNASHPQCVPPPGGSRPRQPAPPPSACAARLTNLHWGTSTPDAADAGPRVRLRPQACAAPPPPGYCGRGALCRPHAGLGVCL